jgi:hypothetical protein
MKKILLLFCFFSFVSIAQVPYQKMLGNTTDWYMFQDYIPISNSNKTTLAGYFPQWGKCSAYKDTLVLGKTYKKFYQVYVYPSPGPGTHVGYIREDSAARKVYWLDKTASAEQLIYDFSLAIGDSVFYTFPFTTGNFPMGYYKLKSVTTVTTPLGLRNQNNLIYKNGTFTSDTLKQIESIGSDIHPIYLNSSSYGPGQFVFASSGCKFPYYLGLACKFTDNVKYFQSCTYVTALSNGCIFKYDSCNYWNTCSGIKENSIIQYFSLYPNPAKDEVTLSLFINEEVPALIEIIDVLGRQVKLVYKDNLTTGENIIKFNSGDVTPGSYFINARIKERDFKTPFIIID